MIGAYSRCAVALMLLLVAHASVANAAKIPMSTSDILMLAGLEPILQHEEPHFTPQAAKSAHALHFRELPASAAKQRQAVSCNVVAR